MRFTVSPRSRQSMISLSTNSTSLADSVRDNATFRSTTSHKSPRVAVFPTVPDTEVSPCLFLGRKDFLNA
jgi:hypothetical protein